MQYELFESSAFFSGFPEAPCNISSGAVSFIRNILGFCSFYIFL